ncbi:hypothetical protein [Rhodococcus sp. UNC363MFTsu5.1]|uniref:hypothetical protein n=1 Tax=Rhodococcus sp. UNC363MFTsu5.1 TaxID=1449069 RepID=UPI000560EB09|nr:hypothetical protein [Rhodococcus sp. UNC363MFTsu5.1]
MTTTQAAPQLRRVLFIGPPAAFVETERWLVRHGLESTRALGDDLLGAIATEDVLDGICSAADAAAVQHVRALGVPCVRMEPAAPVMLLAAC